MITTVLVFFLLVTLHFLKQRHIRQDSSAVFALRSFVVAVVLTAFAVIFQHWFAEWPYSLEVGLFLLVAVYFVVDGWLSYLMNHAINDVEERVVARAVALNAESAAREIIEHRDAIEFEGLRKTELRRRVAADLQRLVDERLKSDACHRHLLELEEESRRARSGDIDLAIWVALHGTNAEIAEVFGVEPPEAGMVFAVPYWFSYEQGGKPRMHRFDSLEASIVDEGEVVFSTCRWRKVEGSSYILLDDSIVRPPT